MDKLEKIKNSIWEHLRDKESYPQDQGECWYVSYVGWNEGKYSHPADLRSRAVDEIFNGNLWNDYDHYKVAQDGWQRIVAIHGALARQFIMQQVTLTEAQIDKMLFEHGLKIEQHGKWFALKRFNRIIEHYLYHTDDSSEEIRMMKFFHLIARTGYKIEDFWSSISD